MDTTKTITHIGLCAGYGGIEIGLSRAIPNLRSVALCEIEAFAAANLVAKMEAGLMDSAPIWTDLKTFPWSEFRGRVDILTGGYPCQPFSAAGKRLGKEDPRHLWPFIADGIAAMRPSICFFENVEGHISLGLPDVIEDLGRLGYRTTWGIFSASEVGAPHQRKRVFIMAYDQRQRIEKLGRQVSVGSKLNTPWDDGSDSWPSRPGQPQYGWEPPRVVGNSQSRTRFWEAQGKTRHVAQSDQDMGDASSHRLQRGQQSATAWAAANPITATGWTRETQPSLGRDIDGSTGGLGYAELCVSCDNRTDELRLLGNGVVPATAELAFRTLLNELLT